MNIKCKKAWNWASTGSPLKQYVYMEIPIIELFKLALDMLIWLFFSFFFQKSYLRPEGKIQTESTSQTGHDFRSWRCCKRCGTHKTVSQVRWKQDTTTQETRIRSDLMKLPKFSFTWLDMFDKNTNNCFITDSNDQLTTETLLFPVIKQIKIIHNLWKNDFF